MTHPVLHPDAEFSRFLADGRFMIQRAPASGRHVFYPRVAEPGTGAELEWVEASGKGHVYSTTISRVKPPAQAYNISLIDLAEGVRLMSKVVDIDPELVVIGMAVDARIEEGPDGPIVVFAPAAPSSVLQILQEKPA